jgi:hypothetical protein
MERLFSSCTRYRDLEESQGYAAPPELLQELNLDVSTGELLSAEKAFTYADLYAILGNEDTVLWLTPHAAVVRIDGRMVDCWGYVDEPCLFYFSADGRQLVALARSPEHLLEFCDVVLRLSAASVVHSVILHKYGLHYFLISAPTLAYL